MTSVATAPQTYRLPTALICAGCGWRALGVDLPFRCARSAAEPGVDHVLHRTMDPRRLKFPEGHEPNPFVRYRTLWHGYHRARAAGMSDADVVGKIEQLDEAVAHIDGRGFVVTSFEYNAPLEAWIKDETGNVSGSHKGRHLFGMMLELLLAGVDRAQPLAIASCGNAALAAAVVARAADWPLVVYVPEEADPAVLSRLAELDAQVTVCPRKDGQMGDPSYLRLHEAIEGGAIPFTCQGNLNGLAIEGGLTIGYEIAEALRSADARLDHLFVQVGGGALASAVIQGLTEAKELGVIGWLPRLHAIQTVNAHPLKRAYDLARTRLLERLGGAPDGSIERLRKATLAGSIDDELDWIARHRSRFMWPWESTPASVATGILDDETYDWLAVVRGMLATGGRPLTVSESELAAANELAREKTGIDVDATGSAGLAGVLQLLGSDEIKPNEAFAVIFTGVRRSGEDRHT